MITLIKEGPCLAYVAMQTYAVHGKAQLCEPGMCCESGATKTAKMHQKELKVMLLYGHDGLCKLCTDRMYRPLHHIKSDEWQCGTHPGVVISASAVAHGATPIGPERQHHARSNSDRNASLPKR